MLMGFQTPARREWEEEAPEVRPISIPEKAPANPLPVTTPAPVEEPAKTPA